MYRAISIAKFGGSECLKIKSLPSVKLMNDFQVRINVKACGVNPVETYIRSGTHSVKPNLPYTPGNDGAGIVVEVGSKVTRQKPGDRVYVSKSITGTYAEECICDHSSVHDLPEHLSFEQGACIGTTYLTAYRALFQRGQATAKDKVLVHGASGGVGTAAVQLGKWLNIPIIGTAGTEDGTELVLKQGAAFAINHKKKDYLDQIMKFTNQDGVNLILEMLANINLNKDLQILAKKGRVMVIGNRGRAEINPRDLMRQESSIGGVYLPNATSAELAIAHQALSDGFLAKALSPIVSKVFALSDAPQAHDTILVPGALGKIVLVP